MKLTIIVLCLVAQASAIVYDCKTSITRMKYGPDDYTKIIEEGRKYEDKYFNGVDQLYWWPIQDWVKIAAYDDVFKSKKGAFQRLSDVYPDATMWGDNNPAWQDIMQGSGGTCYIEASMGAIAEFPDLVKNVFITKEKNDAGIYAFRFYIRGKPWIVTIDDTFLFETGIDGTRKPHHSQIGQNGQMWGMLLEKAWAKLKGTYLHADAGLMENGLRALIGCPVVRYETEGLDADQVFTTLKNADQLNYVMGTGTFGLSDKKRNKCGVATAHAYSLIAAFELMNADGVTIDHKLYMIRNPWGRSDFNLTWNSNDTTSWTAAYQAQVPHGVNPLTSQDQGILFISHTDFLECFQDFQIAHYRDNEGYRDNWYDKVNDNGKTNTYEVTVPAKSGDLYFTVESYYILMVPFICIMGESPHVSLKLYRNDKSNLVVEKDYSEVFISPTQVLEADYNAGDKFLLEVTYTWWYESLFPYPVKDYTVKVYSKQDLEIKDDDSKTNMWFMDGQFPSAFTKSHFRQETTTWTPKWEPKSLTDVWLVSNNVEQFFYLVTTYPHTLFKWFD